MFTGYGLSAKGAFGTGELSLGIKDNFMVLGGFTNAGRIDLRDA